MVTSKASNMKRCHKGSIMVHKLMVGVTVFTQFFFIYPLLREFFRLTTKYR